MKRAIVVGIIFFLSSVALAAGQTVSVQTKNNALRQECTFFSPVTQHLQYGTVLEVLAEKGDWLMAKTPEAEGCIHNRAVQEKIIALQNLQGDASKTGAAEDELSLAGKGFTPEVEQSFQEKNPTAQFKTVDQIEALIISDQELLEFVETGRLNIP
jgi:hypothetical protein